MPVNYELCPHNVRNMVLFTEFKFSILFPRNGECFLLKLSPPDVLPAVLVLAAGPAFFLHKRYALGSTLITNAVSLKAPLSPSPSPPPRRPRGGRLCAGWDHRCRCSHIQVGVTLTDWWMGRSSLWGRVWGSVFPELLRKVTVGGNIYPR